MESLIDLCVDWVALIPEDAGRLTDQVGMSAEFQQIVSQASELGTLIRAGLNVRL
jgi:hypothetical protein